MWFELWLTSWASSSVPPAALSYLSAFLHCSVQAAVTLATAPGGGAAE